MVGSGGVSPGFGPEQINTDRLNINCETVASRFFSRVTSEQTPTSRRGYAPVFNHCYCQFLPDSPSFVDVSCSILTFCSVLVSVDPRPSDRNVRRWPLLLSDAVRSRSIAAIDRRDRQTDRRTDTSPTHTHLPLEANSVSKSKKSNYMSRRPLRQHFPPLVLSFS